MNAATLIYILFIITIALSVLIVGIIDIICNEIKQKTAQKSKKIQSIKDRKRFDSCCKNININPYESIIERK